MESVLKDLRFATRSLRKQPAFTATVIATLALAIGASTAIFSVVEATLLRPLPFRDTSRIAFLWGVAGPQRAIRGGSPIEVQDWARLNRSFENVAIYDETSLSLRSAEGAERVEAEMVSASYFSVLGATPQIGRVFGALEDSVPDANPVVVISDAMWRKELGTEPGAIGRTLTLNDRPFTILGVMKPGFKGISFDTDVWFPAAMARANGGPQNPAERGNRWLGAIGRLRNGVTLEQAQRDMDRVAAQLARDFPENNKDRGVRLFSLRDSYLGSTRTLVLALFGAVGLFLLIACANVVGLQLVRAAGRRRELALRMAIGANRNRLVQQLVVEGMTLAIAGVVVGVAVAYWGLAGLTALAPDGVLPNYAQPSINLVAFGFALVVALACGALFGIVPALRASSLELVGSLKEGSRGSANGFGRRGRLGGQQLLVIAETAVALVLLVGAGLMVRSLQRQLAVDPGFDPKGVLRARLVLPQQQYTPERRLQFVEELRARLSAIPSVRSVAIGSDLPLGGSSSAAFIFVPDVNDRFRYYRHSVTPDYFSSLGIRLVRGRTFTAADRDSAPGAAIISESTARRLWRDANPVGRRLRFGGPDGPEATIVGVVGDARFRDLTTPLATTEPDVYFPMAQVSTRSLHVAVRSSLPPEQIAAAVRREIAAIDPAVPLFGVEPLQQLLDQQTATGRFGSAVLTAFGLSALVLAAVGLYGVLAFLVSLRRREIGIRLALGATSGRVLEGVIAQGTALAAIGLVVGVAAAFFSTRVIESQLFGIGARDPLVFAGAAVALLLVAVVASWVPARRASRVDPQIALRVE
jgi:putative ABC transport system permease protein